jgi:hypothetical protein
LYYAATPDDAAAAGFDDKCIYEELKVTDETARKIPFHQVLPAVDRLKPFQLWKHAATPDTY